MWWVKSLALKYRTPLSLFYRGLKRNSFKIDRGNALMINGVYVEYTQIVMKGYGNEVCLSSEGLSRLSRCKINILGNNNKIIIGANVRLFDCVFNVENDGNIIEIGDRSTIAGDTELAAIEGTKIIIGQDCMFASNITIRTGDSHSVVDLNSGNRCNSSKSINISDHVWVGHSVIILKGSNIGQDSVIATGSVVSGITSEPNSIIGGNPAKVIKKGVSWKRERI